MGRTLDNAMLNVGLKDIARSTHALCRFRGETLMS